MLYRPDPDESAAVPPPPDEALLARYFARIGYSGPARPTLAVLEALQAAHIAAIPFESIDALVEGHIDIGAEAVAAKLIDARRGGYCFEPHGTIGRASGRASVGQAV